ncbi:PREDICTED: anther-specific protein LAT52-like [Ipomoea nil]|uniref:anther-specific protein LAT52-like n=1 Tax=Ipomoea nil TaxID=35883 RepID=UPI00090124E3|nr:PREDICTED: anther-specific protein LAT52-like [Ipomoea nil]
MARVAVVALISALSILALATTSVHGAPAEKFTVRGKVYCDTCRVQFQTRISEYMAGVVVRLDCKNTDNETVTYSAEGETGADGKYNLSVDREHENDTCEVTVVKSPKEDCKETMAGLEKATVVCTENVGVNGSIRYANPLFFMKNKADERCHKVLEEINFSSNENMM